MPTNRSERAEITLDTEDATAEKMLEYCEEFGVCIIDSYLSVAQIEDVRGEIDDLYENIDSTRGVRTHFKADYQHALNIDYDDIDRSLIPSIQQLVTTPEFESVVGDYYDETDVLYPSNLFIARSYGTEDSPEGVLADGPPYALHYDKQNKFKYFFYLTDVTLDEGPTHFAPGLHRGVKECRLEELAAGKPVQTLSNTIEDVDRELVPAIGDAGTLLIFDTDVPHHAGGLTKGHDREVLRIDCYSPTHSGIPTTLAGKVRNKVATLLS